MRASLKNRTNDKIELVKRTGPDKTKAKRTIKNIEGPLRAATGNRAVRAVHNNNNKTKTKKKQHDTQPH
jgi:hypothetical protein